MAIVLEQLIRNLTDSGLLPADEVTKFEANLSSRDQPVDPEVVVQELITAGKLTAYQAECVCQGETYGLVFGDYIVLDKIGQGGMGVVLKAEHKRMDRTAAVKRLTPELVSSQEAVDRFYQEAKAAARLNHPNIVTAYDATEHDGIHCLIMEYVVGRDLANIVNQEGPLPVYHAVEYTLQAAHGLEYAHQMGVVHRDIKPSNLLVTLELDEHASAESADGSGSSPSRTPHHQLLKILDFGLARIERQAGDDEQLTSNDQVMGTCDYMAPEQATDPHGADPRADIYALGCTLYRLLVGESPYGGSTAMAVLMAHRDAPIPSLKAKRPEIPAELDKVFQRMVAKKPEGRFQSMTDVIAALAAIHKPDKADAATITYLAGFPGAPWATASGTASPNAEETRTAQGDTHPSVMAPAGSNAGRGVPAVWIGRRTLWLLAVGIVSLTVLATVITQLWLNRGRDSGTTIVQIPAGAEIITINADSANVVVSVERPITLSGHTSEVWSVAFSSDGQLLASAGVDKTIKLWDPSQGKQLREITDNAAEIRCVTFAPDGQMLASGGKDTRIVLWDPQTCQVLRTLEGHSGEVRSLAFAPDGGQLASAGYDGRVRLWDPVSGDSLGDITSDSQPVLSVAVSHDGSKWATSGEDRKIRLWDAATNQLLQTLTGHGDGVCRVAFSPDGQTLASASWDGTVRQWDVEDGKKRLVLDGHEGDVRCVAFSSDGRLLASAGHDMTIRLWDVANGQQLATLQGHNGPVTSVAFSPDGSLLASASGDKTVKLWPIRVGPTAKQVAADSVEPGPPADPVPPPEDGVTDAPSSGGDASPEADESTPTTQWKNLLPEIDLDSGALVEGSWSREDGELTVEADPDAALALPTSLDGSFDLIIRFTRLSPNGNVGFLLPFGSGVAQMTLAESAGKLSSLELLGGSDISQETSPNPACVIQSGREQDLRIHLRVRGDNVLFVVFLDGQPDLHWSGEHASLTVPDSVVAKLPGGNTPVLSVSNARVKFHQITVRNSPPNAPLGLPTQRELESPDPTVPQFPPGEWVDLFDGKTLEGWQECLSYPWKHAKKPRRGPGTVDVQDGQIRLLGLQLHSDIAWMRDFPRENYEVRCDAARTAGEGDFASLVLPVGSGQARFVIGSLNPHSKQGNKQTYIGLQGIDGQDWSYEGNPTCKPWTFEDDRWYHLRVQVTSEKIEAWIDDEQVIDLDRAEYGIDLPNMDNTLFPSFGIMRSKAAESAIRSIRLRRLPEKTGTNQTSRLIPPGEWFDLLPHIDPQRDTVRGDWRIEAGALVTGDTQYAMLCTRCQPPEEYSLEVEVTRQRVEGGLRSYPPFGIGLVAGGRQCKVLVGQRSYGKGKFGGIEHIDGVGVNFNGTRNTKLQLDDDTATVFVCTVHPGRIMVEKDGEQVMDWRGEFDRLASDGSWNLGDNGRIWLAKLNGLHHVTRLRIKPLSAPAEIVPITALEVLPPVESADLNRFRVTLLKRLEGHQHDVFSVAFSGDGKTVVSGGGDMSVRYK